MAPAPLKSRKSSWRAFIRKKTPWWLKRTFDEREKLLQANPVTYYITEHYTSHPLVLVRLPTVQRNELRELLINAWRREAPKRLVEEFDSN